MTRHRRRSLLLAALAAVLGVAGLRDGGTTAPAAPPAVSAVVAARPLAAGTRLAATDLALVRVPASPLTPHLAADRDALVGARVAVPLAAGEPVTAAALARTGPRAGTREVAVRLDETAGVPAGALAGARADLYLTVPGRRPRSVRVLRAAEVVAASAATGGAVATLRVDASAVPAVLAAEAAGTLRLVTRPGAAGGG